MINKKKVTANIARLAVIAMISFIMFQVSFQLNTLVFNNRYDETQIIRLRCFFKSTNYTVQAQKSDVTGENYTLLTVQSVAANISVYSTSFSLNELKSAGYLTTSNDTILLAISSSILQDNREYIISGNAEDFYNMGNKSLAPLYTITEFHEPRVLEEIITENQFSFVSMAILSWIITASCVLTLVACIGTCIDSLSPDPNRTRRSLDKQASPTDAKKVSE